MKIFAFVLVAIYIFGVVRFLKGFNKTSFTQNHLPLALLWPLLFIINDNYRRNFTKALKGN